MDAASAPRPQSQSSIMMLAASAKNLAFEASHSPAITGSNATTPRDAINAGRVIDPAQLTPDDRDRRSSRHTRRDFEGRNAKRLHEPSAGHISRSPLSCAACASGRSYRDRGRGQEPKSDFVVTGMRSHKGAGDQDGENDRLSLDAVIDADTNRRAESISHTCRKGEDREENESAGGSRHYAFLQGSSHATPTLVNDDRSSQQERGGQTDAVEEYRHETGWENETDGEEIVSPLDLALGVQTDAAPLPPLPLVIPGHRTSNASGSYRRHDRGYPSPLGTSVSLHSKDGDIASVGEERSPAVERKKTLTWEAFLASAQHRTVKEGEEGRAGEASGGEDDGRGDDNLFAEERIRPMKTRVVVRQQRLAESPDPPGASRYPLENTVSIRSSRSWIDDNATEEGDEVESEEAVARGTVPEERSRLSVPQALSDLDLAIQSRPSNIDVSRAQSLSPRGMQALHDPRKKEKMGVNKFNVNPKEGLNYLVEEGLIEDNPESICEFLSTVSGLSKRRLGEYFGRDNPVSQKVLSLFLKRLNFNKLDLDESLRAMVLKFRMPGEAQQIDRVLERFSERYHEENPGTFSCSQTAYILAFSLMMLNTDMYNRNLKEGDKMTESQFVNNNRGIDQGRDIPKEELQAMYRRVKEAEIRMDEGDMFESEVITFVAPKKSGWLKKKGTGYVNKWKKHWFVLADAVLYYFLAPQHQDEAPRCIIPLERVNIDPIGTTDLSISISNHGGYVKSVKMMDDGHMEQGHHRSFVFRAETPEDRDDWVRSLRAEVPANSLDWSATGGSLSGSMYMSRSLSATPATSSVATPIGTPSESGRRMSKFSSLRDRKRRATLEATPRSKMQPPVIRGWVRTKSDQQQAWGRRYIALFRGPGGPASKDAIYFFGDAAMCDKMVAQSYNTSHLCIPLNNVNRMQLRQEAGSGGRAIVLQTGGGNPAGTRASAAKELVIMPEEQRDFSSWVSHIQDACPLGAQYSIAADGTPFSSSIGGETTFLSNATLEEHTQEESPPAAGGKNSVAASVGLATIPSALGIAGTDDSDVAESAGGTSAAGGETAIDSNGETNGSCRSVTSSRKGGNESSVGGGGGSVDYNRTESHDTQPPPELAPPQELDRMFTTLSTATEHDPTHLQGEEYNTIPKSPQSAKSGGSADVVMPGTRSIREDSTAGTDVE